MAAQRVLGRVERSGLAFEHHRDAVAHRKREPVGRADQFLALVQRRPSPCSSGPLQSGQTSS